MPGNSVANSIAVNPTVSTTYTAQAFVNGSCFYTGTLQISPTIPNFSIGASTASICPGSNGILSAIGSYSTILWSPGNYTYSPVTITPTGNVIYTATATSSLGCITTKTIAITVPFLPVSITTNSTNICTGGSVTLTAVGAGTFCGSCVTWYPPVISSNSLVVSPSVTTVYSAQIVNPLGCIATPTQQINVSTFTIVPSFANSCAGSLGTLTAAGGFTSVVWQPGGYTVNPLSVTVTPNLTYTATANFSNGCVATQTFAFGIVDISPPNFQITTNFPVTCAGNSETLSISSPYLTSIVGTTWIPSGTISPTLVITPTASATYSAYVANTSGCVFLAIGSVNVSTACCTGTYSALANVGVVTQTITGSKVVNGNIVIPAGGNLTLSGEFLFAPNVKITVNPGASIHLKDAHLYSCSNTMWQGIEILDGASLTSLRYNKDNLIEDAITAINAMNQATTSLSAVLTISNTTFNKNYVDININNYMRTSTNYPFVIKSCVFTCRNLPFNASTWPQTGTVSAAASNSADLRYIVPGSLSGLSGPYLTQGFSTTPLKNPHSSQGSQTAIQLTNVGITNFSSPYCITIGDGTVTANTNVFDAHNKFIDATNSNVKSYNNIYQNTQVVSGAPGIAIQSRNTYTNSAILNSELNLLAPSNPAVNINRFYNCHTGVNAINLAWLTAQYAEFKSTQSTTVAASTSNPGQFGINITTNRVYSYLISNCNFINLTTGVYGANTSGAINPFGSPAVNGQVWGSFIINYNTFSPSTSTVTGTNFMRDGVIIEALISARGMAGSALAANVVTVSPLNGLRIQNNNFNLVYRGVRVSNFTNSLIGKFTANNTIKLKQDHISSNTQWGVNHSNNYASVVNTNAIAGFTNSLTFTVSGVYSSMNANSSAQCNSLTVLPIDMQFTGFNSTVWRRNNMSASSRGIQLSSNGIMGQQGTFSSPNDNVWTGSWTGTNYNTFSSGSLPNLSLLYKRTLTLYNPTNNLGAPFTYSPGVSLFNANNSAPYGACAPSVKPNRGGDFIKINLAKAIASGTITYPGFFSTETNEINQILLYGELDEDSILLSSDAALQSFFSTNQSGNLGALATINELLCAGDLTSASTALNNFSENSTMQSNYKLYYQLYLVYLDPALDLSAADLTNLQNLAAKCPFIDGPVVYNARSLYTTVTGLIGDYNDEACDENENNLMFNQEELERTSAKRILAKSGAENYQMYPNPASDKLYILGKSENEEITIEIKDLANKLLFRKVTQLSQYNTELKLDLINGVYFVTLINSNDERTTKKLVISK